MRQYAGAKTLSNMKVAAQVCSVLQHTLGEGYKGNTASSHMSTVGKVSNVRNVTKVSKVSV